MINTIISYFTYILIVFSTLYITSCSVSSNNTLITSSFPIAIEYDSHNNIILLQNVNYDPSNSNYQLVTINNEGNSVYNNYIKFGESNPGRISFKIDRYDNYFIWLTYIDSISFGNNNEYVLHSSGDSDMVLVKYNSYNDVIFTKGIGSKGFDYASYLNLGNNGNIYVAGQFTGVLNLDSSINTIELNEDIDYFVAKYNFDGEYAWGTSINFTLSDFHIDENYNIYLAGYSDNILNMNANMEDYINNYQIYKGYIAKYDSTGNMLFRQSIEDIFHNSNVYIKCISADDEMNAYICGNYCGVLNIDNMETTHKFAGDKLFMAKYSNNGELLWCNSFVFEGNPYDLDIFNYRIYIVGAYYNIIINNNQNEQNSYRTNGGMDAFLIIANSEGKIEEIKTWGAEYNDWAQELEIDNNGNIYILGKYEGEVIFDNYIESGIINGNGTYIAKYDKDGNFVWVWTNQ